MTPEERKAKQRERMRKWKAANKESVAAYMKRWRADNAEHIKAYNRKSESRKQVTRRWRQENREHLRDYANNYYSRNRERIIPQLRASFQRNKEKRLAAQKIYNAKNRDRLNAQQRARDKANPQAFRARYHKALLVRRARLSKAPGVFDYAKFLERCAFFGWKCRYCETVLTEMTVTCDHQIPICRDGSNWAANLVPACLPCNKRKNTKTPSEFRAYIALITSPHQTSKSPSRAVRRYRVSVDLGVQSPYQSDC